MYSENYIKQNPHSIAPYKFYITTVKPVLGGHQRKLS